MERVLTSTRFVANEKWRKEFGTDDLVRNFKYTEKPEVFKFYPQFYHKTDKVCSPSSLFTGLPQPVPLQRSQHAILLSPLTCTPQDGRPVYIEQYGNIDLNAMYKITTGDRMLQNLVVEYEKVADPRLPACSRKAGKLLETCCTIMDMKGVGVTRIPSVYGYVKQASAISQDHYPERLGKLYIINAPWGFSSVFSVVKGFLDPVTVSKIHVLGSGYQSDLLKQVPKENLPKAFGGTCECPGGCEYSDAGPWQDSQWVKPPKWARETTGEAKQEHTAHALPAVGGAAALTETAQAPVGAGRLDAPAPA